VRQPKKVKKDSKYTPSNGIQDSVHPEQRDTVPGVALYSYLSGLPSLPEQAKRHSMVRLNG
jgi:hypothetical protein